MAGVTTYSEETTDIICQRISLGESLKTICEDDEMPSQTTVFKWLSQQPLFLEKYARAREAQADALFDDILTIADDGRNDWMQRQNDEGDNIGWRENGEAIRRSQLRIDARKWMAGKLRPKKYGEKISAELTGADGGPIEMKSVTPERRKAAIATILARKAKD